MINPDNEKNQEEREEDQAILSTLSIHNGKSDCHYYIMGGEYANQEAADLLLEITDATGGRITKLIYETLSRLADTVEEDKQRPTNSVTSSSKLVVEALEEKEEPTDHVQADTTEPALSELDRLHDDLHKLIQCSMLGWPDESELSKAHQLLYKIKAVSAA